MTLNHKRAVFIRPGSVYVDKVKLLFLREELSQPLWFAADALAQLVWNFPGCKVVDLFRSGKTLRQQRQKERERKTHKFMVLFCRTADVA